MARFTEWHVEQYQVARVVQYEHHHLTPEHHAEVLTLRKEMDSLVRDVLDRGVADGTFSVDDSADTALALLSIVVDVARWYSPTIRRTPAEIGCDQRRPRAAARGRRALTRVPTVTAARRPQRSLGAPGAGACPRAVRRGPHRGTTTPTTSRPTRTSSTPTSRPSHRSSTAVSLTQTALDVVAEIAAATSPFASRSRPSTRSPTGSSTFCPSRRRPFAALTETLWAAFPQCPPYAGRFGDVVPHLTLDAVSEVVSEESTRRLGGSHVPARCRAERLDLAWYEPGACRVLRSWRLARRLTASARRRAQRRRRRHGTATPPR